MKAVAARLRDGQDLLEDIKKIADDIKIEAGVILSSVGSLKESKIRMPVIDGNVKYISPSNLEIDSLQGTVSVSGCHLRIVVSDVEGKVYGGHVNEGCTIRTTYELVIGVLEDTKFRREPDSHTGFDNLIVNT